MAPSSPIKPAILIYCTPVYGHVMPMRAIASALITRGYNDIFFVTAVMFEEAITSTGATFIPFAGRANLTPESFAAMRAAIPPPTTPESLLEFENFIKGMLFVDMVPLQHQGVLNALKEIQTRWPGRKTVMLGESCCNAGIPFQLGAPCPAPCNPPAGFIGIGVVPIFMRSIDHPPFGRPPLDRGPPPKTSTPSTRAQNHKENEEYAQRFSSLQDRFLSLLANDIGTTKKLPRADDLLFDDVPFHLPDTFLQLCGPSFEYPRSDAPKSLRCIGSLPPGHRDPPERYPSWWDELITSSSSSSTTTTTTTTTDLTPTNKKKKIVLVAQGSLALNYDDLIIPTLKALSSSSFTPPPHHQENITTVIALLGKPGATLPPHLPIPANAHILDFFPYDDILPYVDCFVTNGGYGSVQHAIRHGVPLVVAGQSEDKAEVCARVEWSGMGVDLRCQAPTEEQVRAAVARVLGIGIGAGEERKEEAERFKMRAEALRREVEGLDTLGLIEEEILRLATR